MKIAFSYVRKKRECVSMIGQMGVEFVLSDFWKNNCNFGSKEIEELINMILMTSFLLTARLEFES